MSRPSPVKQESFDEIAAIGRQISQEIEIRQDSPNAAAAGRKFTIDQEPGANNPEPEMVGGCCKHCVF